MSTLELLFSGDLILDEPQPDHWLSGIAPALQRATLAIGHLEIPHTQRGTELKGDVPAPGAPPSHLAALARAGFDALTLAGNHMADCGAQGIADTVDELDRLGLAHCGAGADLARARRPAQLRTGDWRIALLSYNCVGPEASWATDTRAGCAYVRIDATDGRPVSPNAALVQPNPASVAAMAADIRAARVLADCVIVGLHKGIVHTPAKLAPYERPLSQAAIDAGADIVIGHHAHILRGIEVYRGKPIFHGLGNGCVVTRALSPDQAHPARAEWARRRRELFGFEPDPAYSLAPFHPDAVQGMLARVRCIRHGASEVGFIPVHVEPPGRPVLANALQAEQIAHYVQRISHDASLPPLSLQISADGVRLT